MLLKFKTIDGNEIRAYSKTIKIAEVKKNPDPMFGPYLVMVGEEHFTYGVSEDEFKRLCKDFDKRLTEQ